MRRCANPAAVLATLRAHADRAPPDGSPYVTDLFADDGSKTPSVTITLHSGTVFVQVNRSMQALARATAPPEPESTETA